MPLRFLPAVVLLVAWSSARAEADHAAIARVSLEHYIRPAYSELAASAARLREATAQLCNTPSAQSLKAARNAFAGTVDSWSKIEPVRFGPVEEEHRYERLFYWPDPKGLGTRQIREGLLSKDDTLINAATLSAKSVALQGLPALEYLLYGEGADALAQKSEGSDFRCRYSKAIADNIAVISSALVEGWNDGSPYAKLYLNPGPDNQAYRNEKEVTLELFKTLVGAIESVRDQKLAKMLGPTPEEAKPQLAPFWRSNLTFENLAGNLQGARVLFKEGGFAQLVHSDIAGAEDSILFDLDHATEVISGFREPVDRVVRNDAAHAKLEALRVSLKGAATTAGDIIARATGLSFGFNAMDGD